MQTQKKRVNEKGAAMVMVLMISLLLLVASAGLLLEVSMNTANVTDATAEQQAYNAAESGLQSAIDVLRGNTVPNPLIDNAKPANDPINRISFRKAVTLSTSNLTGETTTSARLSRWMNYNYPAGNAATANRIALNSGYDPRTGYAFAVTIADPDNTGNIISYNTQGRFYDSRDSTNPWKSSITYGTSPDTVTISYTPKTVNNLDVSSGSANTDYGSFIITTTGSGADFPNPPIRFDVVVNMTAPYTHSVGLFGYVTPGSVSSSSAGTVKFDFDSKVSDIIGSSITLNNDPLTPNAPNTPNGTPISGNMTQAEPYRIVISSVGYGPRGAKKILEATVERQLEFRSGDN